MSSEQRSRSASFAIACVVVLAAVLRFWDLDRTSLWLDEAISWSQAKMDFMGLLRSSAADQHPPLHNAILWLQVRIFGDSETSLRFPSALFSVAGVFAIYRLGRELWDAQTGLVAALLLAVLPIHIWYAQDARVYPLLGLVSTLYVLSVTWYLRDASVRKAGVCGVAALVLLLTHVYGTFVFGAVNLFMLCLLFKQHRRVDGPLLRWLVSQGAAFIAFGPWLFYLAKMTLLVVEVGFWIPYPDLPYLRQLSVDVCSVPLQAAALAGLLALSARKVAPLFRRSTAPPSDDRGGAQEAWRAALILVWLTGPLAIAYVLSIALVPIIHPRYLLCVAPAFLLLLARGLFLSTRSAHLQAGILFVLLAVMLPGAISTATEEQRDHDDWRAVTAMQRSRLRAGDETVIYQAHGRYAYRYYARGIASFFTPLSFAEAAKPLNTKGRLWMIFTRVSDAEQEQIIDAYRAAGFSVQEELSPHGLRLLLLHGPAAGSSSSSAH